MSELSSFKNRLREAIIPTIILLSLICIWEIISRAGIFVYIMPPFSLILIRLIQMLVNGQLTEHIVASLIRSFMGFALAATLGVSLGIILGWSRRIYKILESPIELFRPIPSIALIPLAILWFGIGEASKIFIIAFACFWPILMNTIYGVRGIDDYMIKSAKSMNAKTDDLLFKVAVPAASPYIFGGLRISLAMSFILLIGSEMVAAQNGLGFLILLFEETFRIKEMYGVLILIVLLAYLSNRILLKIEDHYIAWHKAITIAKR